MSYSETKLRQRYHKPHSIGSVETAYCLQFVFSVLLQLYKTFQIYGLCNECDTCISHFV